MIQSDERVLIKVTDVCAMLSVNRNTVHVYGKRYADFPKPVKAGLTRQSSVRYVQSEVREWIESRMNQRTAAC